MNNSTNNICFIAEAGNFAKIPGSPISYWISLPLFDLFEKSPKLGELCISKTGMTTGNNDLYLRFWYEISNCKIDSKWFFYNKGGGYRKWYGNIENVIIWENDGELLKNNKTTTIRNPSFYFRKCISWNLITTDRISVRALENKFVMGDAGPACYIDSLKEYYSYLALLNSCVADYLLKIINPTINYSCGVMEVFPVCNEQLKEKEWIITLSEKNVSLAKEDWDSRENSFDFKKHPLL